MASKGAHQHDLLKLVGVTRHFQVRGGIPLIRKPLAVRAVDGVDLEIAKGETLSLVGESGSGKTTLGRVALGLQPATSGTVSFDGQEIKKLSIADRRALRKRMQIVFQDPFGSLNPRLPIGDQIEEGLLAHQLGDPRTRERRVREVLDLVGLDPNYASRYPHEFSGGQRQRVGIARALAVNPEFIVLDEPVSALDVSIQSQVLNLLTDLRNEKGLTYLFISHNLDVVGYFSDRVAVMYLGKVVEVGPVDRVFTKPQHPYTVALISAVPKVEAHDAKDRLILAGEIPSPIAPPSGCRFRTRCWLREQLGNPEKCSTEEPKLVATPRDVSVNVACHFPLADGAAATTAAGRAEIVRAVQAATAVKPRGATSSTSKAKAKRKA
ncbi:MAG: ABC transporter ATP-binding protein [Chloroflexi bacterium]|nr:ABC transporter ATP-binding protein [Chloroflexota bacterium]